MLPGDIKVRASSQNLSTNGLKFLDRPKMLLEHSLKLPAPITNRVLSLPINGSIVSCIDNEGLHIVNKHVPTGDWSGFLLPDYIGA